ncbi:MAG: hypothetical protein ACRCZ9_09845, partial [Fusobacteriaceae bacterium]
LLKIVKDRDFSNVLTRLKLKLPLTIMSLEKLEVFYENLMKDIYIDKDSDKNVKEELEIKEFNINPYIKNKTNNFGKWSDYEMYLLNRTKLSPIVLKLSLDDIKEIYSEAIKIGILTEMERRQMSNIITWLKFNTPLIKLNVKKLEEIYIKLMENLFEKDAEKQKENNSIGVVEKTFEDIFNEGLKSGFVNMEDLKKINFEDEDNVYDIYEAIEIMEERGVRINY